MIQRRSVIVAAAAALAGCTATAPTKPPAPIARPAPAPTVTTTGLERVMGQDARSLAALFGNANQDVREMGARRLQFSGPICILDTYLYPPATGKEPVVTHVDARQADGRDIDRASCIAALTRRVEAR